MERKMDDKRYREIDHAGGDIPMTEDEMSAGWHFCPDWDYMLIGPGMEEYDGCTCKLP